ncbi:MAG: hypothetical protein ACE5GK_10360 [Nitrospiria bacterium]
MRSLCIGLHLPFYIYFGKDDLPAIRLVRLIRLLPFLLVFFILLSCTADKKKPTPVTNKLAHVRGRIEKLREFYEKKDDEGFFSGLDPSFEGLQVFQKRVRQDFSRFSKAEISVIIDRVEMDEDTIKTAVRWRGLWVWEEAPPLEKNGSATFIWTSSKDSKLVGVLGEGPFGVIRP